MTSEPDYDPQADGMGSYYAAIAAKKARGDDYYLKSAPPEPIQQPLFKEATG